MLFVLTSGNLPAGDKQPYKEGEDLVDSFNYAFKVSEMSIPQRKGVISLIPKKMKDKNLLGNWRPISLLNTDYKHSTAHSTK